MTDEQRKASSQRESERAGKPTETADKPRYLKDYFNKYLYFDEEGNLWGGERLNCGCGVDNPECDHEEPEDYKMYNAEELKFLNEDNGKEVIGKPVSLYLVMTRYDAGVDFKERIVSDAELSEARKPVPNPLYANPEYHLVTPKITPFKVFRTKKGNPLVEIDIADSNKILTYSEDANHNYISRIYPGVMTPEVTLQDGFPGLIMRGRLTEFWEKENPLLDNQK